MKSVKSCLRKILKLFRKISDLIKKKLKTPEPVKDDLKERDRPSRFR